MSPFLIAELGINHNGDVELAKRMIDAAANAGFDAVKFQKRTIDTVYAKDVLDSPRESPWGTTQRQQKEGLEFSAKDYQEIDHYCQKLDIPWTASVWDLESLAFLSRFNVPFHKVASAMLCHLPVLRAIAAEGKKTFISTGMTSLEEVDNAVEIFRQAGCPFELMHTNSTYPMKMEDANLLCIPALRERYGVDVGYSGHETCLITVCVAAVALGATSIERHITLDRSMYGSDQSASIECKSLSSFVTAVRAVPGILGDGNKRVYETEIPIREKLMRIESGL
jgi:N-acetylneuraminate synthase